MTRLVDKEFAHLIKEIRRQTTEIEFALMYNDIDDVDSISIDKFLKNALNQLDAAKILSQQL